MAGPGFSAPCCGQPGASFPRPGDRRAGGGAPVSSNANARAPRRRRFYSPGLHRASELVQDPRLFTFRELALLVLALYALYRGYAAGQFAWNLLAVRDVAWLCKGRSVVGCNYAMFWMILRLLWVWAGEVIPWGFVCAAVVFVGEEVMGAISRRK